ncbi:beta-propeller domain-containing protein [Haloglycomyces albus]|uniref:beta-propeller domain-containing protein n=1 Tax=Haloglycomyces albus TaxID=526067 RepID=UPI00146F99F8|nr:beta-propeller domain-containing protein [Haloglycomyces albus]
MTIPLSITALLVVASCTDSNQIEEPDGSVPVEWVDTASLTTYDDCETTLEAIQAKVDTAISEDAGLFGEPRGRADDGAFADEQNQTDAVESEAGQSHSETNVAVAGVDEPDTVKTNGDYIFTVIGDRLRKIDPDNADVLEERDLSERSIWDPQLLLTDNELVLLYNASNDSDPQNARYVIERLHLDDLETVDEVTVEGAGVDARRVEDEIRLVSSSQPEYTVRPGAGYPENQNNLRESSLDSWTPTMTVNGTEREKACDRIALPENYEGTSSLSVFSLPTGSDWENLPEPLTIMGGADTVHGTADSLYVTHSPGIWAFNGEATEVETSIFRFQFNEGEPVLTGEGTAPGRLLNQYSMSEYDSYLRVATTEHENAVGIMDGADETTTEAEVPESRSTVSVFELNGEGMDKVSEVTDLGVGEQIYSVRFIGAKGYIVTFRQTDPLYTIDLTDHENPEVTGELKITGYSAYLHPLDEFRLLGVGQEANEQGRTEGLQATIFDISKSEAEVVDQYHEPNVSSSVEWEPHAFLYWEAESLIALPYQNWHDGEGSTGVKLLRDSGDELEFITDVEHPNQSDRLDWNRNAGRTLVIDDQLWTISALGIMASDLDDFETEAWRAW